MWKGGTQFAENFRALFSVHSDSIIWRPAFEKFSDAHKTSPGTIVQELKLVDPEKFVATYRGQTQTVFSALSKGVHSAFVVPLERVYDAAAVIEFLRQAITALAAISAVANYVTFAVGRHAQPTVDECLKEIEEVLNV
jgi:hypothetical protein